MAAVRANMLMVDTYVPKYLGLSYSYVESEMSRRARSKSARARQVKAEKPKAK